MSQRNASGNEIVSLAKTEEWADGKTTIILNYTAGEGFMIEIRSPKRAVYTHNTKSGEEMIRFILDDRHITLPQTRMLLVAVTAQAAVNT